MLLCVCVVSESQLLSRLLVDLSHQLDPANLPKHKLIQRTPDLIHHLYELHSKPWTMNAAELTGGKPDADAASPTPDATFADELTPMWHASSLVRVRDFDRLRRAGRAEEQLLRDSKAAIAAYDARLQAIRDEHQQDAQAMKAAIEEIGPRPTEVKALTKEVIYSEPMVVHGATWRMKLYPNGNGVAKGEYLSVFVELTASELGNHIAAAASSSSTSSSSSSSSSCPLPLPLTTIPLLQSRSSAPASFGTYHYRVEMLPYLDVRRYPNLAAILAPALKECHTASSPLAMQTVASYIDQILFQHPAESELIAEAQHYRAKIVSRVYSSSFEHGESWGYNRFVKTALLHEEGYLHSDLESAGAIHESGGVDPSSGNVSSSPSSSGDLFFRFYIRPPTFYLASHEQRIWIDQLETCVRQQASEIQRIKNEKAEQQNKNNQQITQEQTNIHTHADTQRDTRTTPTTVRGTTEPNSTSSAANTSNVPFPSTLQPSSVRGLTAAEIRHAVSSLPAASLPSLHSARNSDLPHHASSTMTAAGQSASLTAATPLATAAAPPTADASVGSAHTRRASPIGGATLPPHTITSEVAELHSDSDTGADGSDEDGIGGAHQTLARPTFDDTAGASEDDEADESISSSASGGAIRSRDASPDSHASTLVGAAGVHLSTVSSSSLLVSAHSSGSSLPVSLPLHGGVSTSAASVPLTVSHPLAPFKRIAAASAAAAARRATNTNTANQQNTNEETTQTSNTTTTTTTDNQP